MSQGLSTGARDELHDTAVRIVREAIEAFKGELQKVMRDPAAGEVANTEAARRDALPADEGEKVWAGGAAFVLNAALFSELLTTFPTLAQYASEKNSMMVLRAMLEESAFRTMPTPKQVM